MNGPQIDGERPDAAPGPSGHPRRSSHCAGGACVHVQLVGDQVLVMASPDSREALVFSHDEWDAFLAGVHNGEFTTKALRQESSRG